MASEPDHGVDIIIAADGSLTINGVAVVLENGSIEGDCIRGSLRGEGIYVPRVSIPLDMCRMGLTGAAPAEAAVEDRPLAARPRVA